MNEGNDICNMRNNPANKSEGLRKMLNRLFNKMSIAAINTLSTRFITSEVPPAGNQSSAEGNHVPVSPGMSTTFPV